GATAPAPRRPRACGRLGPRGIELLPLSPWWGPLAGVERRAEQVEWRYLMYARTAPGLARELTRETLSADVSDEAVQCCEVLVPELVTNALVHGRPPLSVRIEQRDDRVRV